MPPDDKQRNHRRRCISCDLPFVLTVLVILARASTASNVTDTPVPGTQSVFDSPYYNDSDSFLSARAAALGASILSGLCGQPLTSAHVYRTVTLLSMCRPATTGKLPPTEVPISVRIGSNALTQFYAGGAIINPLFFLFVAAFTALLSLILSKVNGRSWRMAFVTGRYPSHLMFPFFFFLQTSVTCALTVIMEPSAETGVRVACGLSIAFWIVLTSGIGYYLFKNVPVKARYVRNFREISAESNKVQLELRRRIAELEATMLREEKEAEERAALLRQQQEDDAAQFNLLHGEKEGSSSPSKDNQSDRSSLLGGVGRKLLQGLANTESHLNRLVTKLLPGVGEDDEQDELARHIHRIEHRRQRTSAQDRERIRRATNLMYSKMLSSQLSVANRGETALQEAFTGKDRWEDADPDDTSQLLDAAGASQPSDDDLAGALIPAALADYLAQRENTEAKSKTGFLHQWSNLFARYRERSYCFLLVEIATSFVCGLLEGWKPTSGSSSSCNGPAIALVIMFCGYFVTLVVVFPHISKFEGIAFAFIALLQTISAVFVLVGIASPDITSSTDWVPITSYVLAVFTIYLLVLKSLSDAITVVSPFFASKERQWDISALTEKYFDASRETTSAIETLKAKANEILRGDDEGGASPSQKQQELTDAKSASGNGRPSDEPGSTVSMKVLSETHGDIRQYSGIGGRNNAFVVSRGVPESLHPFVMAPVPGIIPLPVRQESTVRRVKKAMALKEMAMSMYHGAGPSGVVSDAAQGDSATSKQLNSPGKPLGASTATTVGGGIANNSFASSVAGAGSSNASASGGTDIISGAVQYMQAELVKDLAKDQAKAMKKLEAERFEQGLQSGGRAVGTTGGADSSSGSAKNSKSQQQERSSNNSSSAHHSTTASVQNDRWFRRDENDDDDDARRMVKLEAVSRILTTTSDVFKKLDLSKKDSSSNSPAAASAVSDSRLQQNGGRQQSASPQASSSREDVMYDDDGDMMPSSSSRSQPPRDLSSVLRASVGVFTRRPQQEDDGSVQLQSDGTRLARRPLPYRQSTPLNRRQHYIVEDDDGL